VIANLPDLRDSRLGARIIRKLSLKFFLGAIEIVQLQRENAFVGVGVTDVWLELERLMKAAQAVILPTKT